MFMHRKQLEREKEKMKGWRKRGRRGENRLSESRTGHARLNYKVYHCDMMSERER